MTETILFRVFEILAAGYVLFLCVRIMRSPLKSNLLNFLALLLALAVSWIVQVGVYRLLSRVVSNIVSQMLISVVISLLAFFAALHGLNRIIKKNTDVKEDQSKRIPSVRLLGNAILVAVLLCGTSVLLYFMVNLAAMSPISALIKDKSLLFRIFVDPEATTMETGPSRSSDDTDSAQLEFIAGLQNCFVDSRNFLAEKTGTKQALQQIAALVRILNLPPDQSRWLIDSAPELKAVSTNSALNAIIDDPHIIDLVLEISRGSARAIFTLGDDERIRALLEDKEITQELRHIDLIALAAKADDYQENDDDTFPIVWETAAISFPLEMDAALTNSAAWSRYEDAMTPVTWPRNTRFALARSAIAVDAPTSVLLCCETRGTPTLWLNNVKTLLRRGAGRMEVHTVLSEGETRILVLIDFRNANTDKSLLSYLIVQEP